MHAQALVRIDTPADVGLFAEGLIYFDRVGVRAATPEALAGLIGWFLHPGEVETFLIYLREGVIDLVDEAPSTFRQRFLEHDAIAQLTKGQWRHSRLLAYAANRVLAVPETPAAAGSGAALVLAATGLSRDVVLPRALAQEALASMADTGRVERLSVPVPFPDVRRGVTEGRFDLRAVQDLRRAGRPLRAWLQQKGPRDVADFVALHGPAGRATPWQGEKELMLAGDLRGAAAPDREGPIVLAV